MLFEKPLLTQIGDTNNHISQLSHLHFSSEIEPTLKKPGPSVHTCNYWSLGQKAVGKSYTDTINSLEG